MCTHQWFRSCPPTHRFESGPCVGVSPSLTYIASANAITYCGAKPVFIDSEPETGNLDPARIEEALTPATKAIVVVHLYGHPVDMGPVSAVARAHGLKVIEDCAEAHGALYRGQRVGTLGDVATFSFFGNKIISTGEGGMVLTADESLAVKVRMIRGQEQDPERRYWFPIVGFNYRMTNVAAAIGLAQVERLEWHVERRRENASWYQERLTDTPGIRVVREPGYAQSAFWMNSVLLEDSFALDRETMMRALAAAGIETRPWFYPAHTMPAYEGYGDPDLPVAMRLSASGITLPSSARLTREDVDYVCDTLVGIAEGA